VVGAVVAEVGAFFVGPGKCGTSWVFDTCRTHPGVNVGRIKEPGEFLKRDVELDAYHRLWEGPGVRCDFSNTYFFSDTAAEGIRRYNPQARICITVRDPLSRLVSRYMFMRRNARFEGPIDAAIAADPQLVDWCLFGKHSERWLARFAPGQMLVLRLETLQTDPDRYRQALFDFLGVPDDAAYMAPRQSQSAALPRSRLLARGTKELADLARKARLFGLIDRVKRSRLAGLLYRPLPATYQDAHLDAIPAGVKAELQQDYDAFVTKVSRVRGVRIV
jgi:Sulfotransferase domain